MRILITGASGFVGKNLASYLASKGHEIIPLQRGSSAPYSWDPEKKWISKESLENFDCMIHLAGENITKRRWTEAFKEKLWKSRVDATEFLISTLLTLKNPPKIFISASAIGIYGNQEGKILDESAPAGDGFLSKLSLAWERASLPLEKKGIRLVHLRFGLILSSKGGALAKMVPLFKLGLGATFGSGKQMMSWIDLKDLIRAIDYIIHHDQLKGPINCTSPYPINNKYFTQTLGNVLKKPTFLKIPAIITHFLFGEMAEALFLSNLNIQPKILLKEGFIFQSPSLLDCLKENILLES